MCLGAILLQCGANRRPNILLITVDTLRADHVGAYGSRTAQTPTFDRLASRGLLFSDAFTTVPVTLASHATLLTGRLPAEHGVRGNSFYKLSAEETTLAEILKGAGYRTAAVVGAAVLDRRFGLDQGFDLYDDETTSRAGTVLIAERNAAAVVSRAIAWLMQRPADSPFFLWVHLFDPHDPYRPPEPFASQFARSPYDGEIAYADQEVGRLLDTLDSQAVLEHTLVVLTADHGESLGEHGESTHGIFLYDATLRVPLIFAGPGIPREVRKNRDPVGPIDVLPTILARLGIPPPATLAGLDLLARQPPSREYFYAETYLPQDFYNWSPLRSLRSSRVKFIQAPTPELYDLVADPNETRNQAPRADGEIRRLAPLLDRFDKPGRKQDASKLALDGDLAERLRSLGYVAGGAPARSAPSEAQRPDPKSHIQLVGKIDEALSLVHGGRLEDAVAALRAILAIDPGNYLAEHMLADVLFDLARDTEAIDAYRRAAAGGRETAYDHYRLGLLHERRREYQLAAAEFGRLIRLNPGAAQEVLDRGNTLLKNGAAAGALLYFEMLEAAGGSGPALELPRVEARLQAGKLEAALAGLDHALRRDPHNQDLQRSKVRVLNVLGQSRGEAGKLSDALAAFTAAVQLAPEDFESLANLGLTQLRAKQNEAALSTLARALAVRPEEVRLLNLVAELRFRRREFDLARDLLRRSLAVNPAQPKITEALRLVEQGRAARR